MIQCSLQPASLALSVLSETRSIRSGSAHWTLSQSKWIRKARHDTHNTRLESRINPLPWVTEGVSSIHSLPFSFPVKMNNAAKRADCWFGAKWAWQLWVEVLSCSLDLALLDSFVLTDRNNINFFGVWAPVRSRTRDDGFLLCWWICSRLTNHILFIFFGFGFRVCSTDESANSDALSNPVLLLKNICRSELSCLGSGKSVYQINIYTTVH